MRTAIIIPGTFNPVTEAHIAMGLTLHEKYPEADIWYVPSTDRYSYKKLKGTVFLTGEERCQLLKKSLSLIDADRKFYVASIEVDGTVDGYTYNTIEYIRNFFKYDKVSLCIGQDNLKKLERWFHIEDLLATTPILVVNRNGKTITAEASSFVLKHQNCFTPIEMDSKFSQISATNIREAFYQNDFDQIEELVPPPVYHYLLEKSNSLTLKR